MGKSFSFSSVRYGNSVLIMVLFTMLVSLQVFQLRFENNRNKSVSAQAGEEGAHNDNDC